MKKITVLSLREPAKLPGIGEETFYDAKRHGVKMHLVDGVKIRLEHKGNVVWTTIFVAAWWKEEEEPKAKAPKAQTPEKDGETAKAPEGDQPPKKAKKKQGQEAA